MRNDIVLDVLEARRLLAIRIRWIDEIIDQLLRDSFDTFLPERDQEAFLHRLRVISLLDTDRRALVEDLNKVQSEIDKLVAIMKAVA